MNPVDDLSHLPSPSPSPHRLPAPPSVGTGAGRQGERDGVRGIGLSYKVRKESVNGFF
jgi:hypothetical protein